VSYYFVHEQDFISIYVERRVRPETIQNGISSNITKHSAHMLYNTEVETFRKAMIVTLTEWRSTSVLFEYEAHNVAHIFAITGYMERSNATD
jgi:hypothetical protein